MKKLCFYTSITVLFTLLNSCRTDETSTAPETETLTSRQIFEKVTTGVFIMSPNPAREQVRIQYNTGNEKNAAKLLIIHDAAGKVRYRKELSSYEGEITVPLNGWLQGVYIVNIVTGDKALQGKLLKE